MEAGKSHSTPLPTFSIGPPFLSTSATFIAYLSNVPLCSFQISTQYTISHYLETLKLQDCIKLFYHDVKL